MEDKLTFTKRGFAMIEMKDSNDWDFRLQDSSAAEDNFVWIFPGEKGAIHLNREMAKRIAKYLNHFVEHGTINNSAEESIK